MRLTVAAVLVVFLSAPGAQARTVRVGVYDNPPKIERPAGGAPRGIFIDIVEGVAALEGWELEYVYGTWDEGLRRLEKGEIDLMPDVAFSGERGRRFDFNRIAVLSSWLQVFAKEGAGIASVAALDGKRVAVLEGSIQQRVMEGIRDELRLDFELIPARDYAKTAALVGSGGADAAVFGRFYGYSRERRPALAPTALILNPTALHFAAPEGRNADLLGAVDRHLAAMMNDPDSVYYRSLGDWLHESPPTFVPRAVKWALAAVLVALALAAALSVALRWQVKRRTRELVAKNAELERALREVTVARSEAVKRERLYALGQLAGGIAHDFNNLLVPLSAYAEMLLEDPGVTGSREDVRRKLETIRSSAAHGAEIVRRMTRFCTHAASAGEKVRVDVDAVVRDVMELAGARWKEIARGSGAPMEVSLELGGDGGVLGRPSQIHELVMNLVLNAQDAMPQGGRLEVRTGSRDGGVTIAVRDEGVGMTDEVRERCLEPFFTTKGDAGTGIGLFMVRSIVAEHGGDMEIASAPGAGTTITVAFPPPPPGSGGGTRGAEGSS